MFGCFFMGRAVLQEKAHWYGSHQNFVFTLSPKIAKYSSTRENQMFLRTGRYRFKIGGGGQGNALSFNETLNVGESYKSFTFRN